MEKTYEEYLEEERKIAKPKLLIPGLIILILILGVYIFETRNLDVESVRRESLALGFNRGVEYWNAAVVSSIGENGTIPYHYNGTYYESNITQMCGGLNS